MLLPQGSMLQLQLGSMLVLVLVLCWCSRIECDETEQFSFQREGQQFSSKSSESIMFRFSLIVVLLGTFLSSLFNVFKLGPSPPVTDAGAFIMLSFDLFHSEMPYSQRLHPQIFLHQKAVFRWQRYCNVVPFAVSDETPSKTHSFQLQCCEGPG